MPETGTAADVFERPSQPETRAFMAMLDTRAEGERGVGAGASS